MSADNWDACPMCRAKAIEAKANMMAEAQATYGNVSAETYEATMALARAMPDDVDEETLREDYSLGINDDATFQISYNAACNRCNYKFRFKHEEDTLKAKAKP